MTKYTIKKRYSDEVLVEGEANSFKEFVEANKSNLSFSNLSFSNLSFSNLSFSNLRGSDLRGSDLRGSDLSGSKIKITQKDEIIKALRIEIGE